MTIFMLLIFAGGQALPLGWFDNKASCKAAAYEIASEIGLSPDGDDEMSCVSYVATGEERES